MSFYELMERASQDVGMTFNEDKYNKFAIRHIVDIIIASIRLIQQQQ